MRRLKQKEITTDKPAKGDQPMRSLRFATTNGKAEGTNNDATSDNLERQKRNRRSRSQQNKKPTSSDRNRSRQPSKTK